MWISICSQVLLGVPGLFRVINLRVLGWAPRCQYLPAPCGLSFDVDLCSMCVLRGDRGLSCVHFVSLGRCSSATIPVSADDDAVDCCVPLGVGTWAG